MATNNNRWIFTDSQLSDTPSRRCGISAEDEANYRFNAATLIRDIGNKLSVYVLTCYFALFTLLSNLNVAKLVTVKPVAVVF